MEIVFKGSEADSHEIEAYAGVVSLEGIARAATLAAHYAATGQVRFRAPYSSDLEFRIAAPVPGSLEFPLKIVSQMVEALPKKKLAAALFIALLSRSTGQAIDDNVASQISDIALGDLDALAEAAEPGMQRAHRWIDRTKKHIIVQSADHGSIKLDLETKEFLESEETDAISSQDVTVSALNANNKTGRVFFEDLRRTVPFKIGKQASPRTLANLSRFLNRYIEKTNEWVTISFIPFRFADGRLKRIMILDCALTSELE